MAASDNPEVGTAMYRGFISLTDYGGQRRRKEFKSGGAKFDGHHGGRAVPLPQPARGVLQASALGSGAVPQTPTLFAPNDVTKLH